MLHRRIDQITATDLPGLQLLHIRLQLHLRALAARGVLPQPLHCFLGHLRIAQLAVLLRPGVLRVARTKKPKQINCLGLYAGGEGGRKFRSLKNLCKSMT